MDFDNIISLLGGVALFLFGMSVMGDLLKKVAGSKMEMILYKLSGNTFKAILLGTGVTAVIQSSSATSVMTVGFVNSGIMKLRQAIGVILGAILGTSITGWILTLNGAGGASGIASVLNTAVITGVTALIGILMRMFAKRTSLKNVGGILLGFAVLMYGMSIMSGAVAPLKEEPAFIKMLTEFSNPFIGILVGAVFTAAIQSASAAVGILQALSMTGSISFDVAFPMLLGIGIGASVPVMISALGAGTNGKRTAFVYLIADLLGAAICGGAFYALNAIVGFDFLETKMTVVTVAALNTLYRLATVIFLSPAISLLERLICRLIPDRGDELSEREDMDRLEERFLAHPAISLEQSKTVINSMAEKAHLSVEYAVGARRELDDEKAKKAFGLEKVLDRYEDKLGSYIYKITASDLTKSQSRVAGNYLRVLSDFERISDHARNVGESSAEIAEKKITFSKDAEQELRVLEDAVCEVVRIAVESFIDGDVAKSKRVDPLEDVIDDLCDELKSRHVQRIGRQECTLENGFVFNDLLTDYERIADHCENIAIDVMEAKDEHILDHEYHSGSDYKNSEEYRRYFAEYEKQFAV